MATATRSSSPSRANGASRGTKRIARRAESTGQQISRFFSRESAAIARRASDMYSSTAKATRNHPVAAVGIVAGVAALLGGLWYAAKNR